MPMMPLSLSVAPRVILDLRDWYASRFTAPLIPDGAGGFKRSIARVIEPATIIAEPINPVPDNPDSGWPFTQPMELVTQDSSEGIRAFHGRLRNSGGVLLQRTACCITQTATCQLRIMARGFVPYVIPSLMIPMEGAAPNHLAPIEMMPAVDYPFFERNRHKALVEGAVQRPDGSRVPDVTITPIHPGTNLPDDDMPATTTTPDGRYLVVLDSLLSADGTTAFPEVEIRLSNPHWPNVISRTLRFPSLGNGRFQPLPRAFFASTIIKGSVLRQNRPVPRATVTVNSDDEPLLTGQVVTNAFGEWTFYGDAELFSDDPDNNIVDVKITVNGQPSQPEQVAHIGEFNQLQPSVIP